MKIKLVAVLLFFTYLLSSQTALRKDKNYYVSAIGFWNVENLYDTLNDPKKNDEDFLHSKNQLRKRNNFFLFQVFDFVKRGKTKKVEQIILFS